MSCGLATHKFPSSSPAKDCSPGTTFGLPPRRRVFRRDQPFDLFGSSGFDDLNLFLSVQRLRDVLDELFA